jgi:predicted nucleic acid-binding protein
VTSLVVDASIAVKWVVYEDGTEEAVALRAFPLLAPDLIIPECANVLWKKVQRGNLPAEGARNAALALQGVNIELIPMQSLLGSAMEIALTLQHPAYDCFYLALARREGCPFVTADRRFLRLVNGSRFRDHVRPLR